MMPEKLARPMIRIWAARYEPRIPETLASFSSYEVLGGFQAGPQMLGHARAGAEGLRLVDDVGLERGCGSVFRNMDDV